MKRNKLLIVIGIVVLIGIVSSLAYKSQNTSASDDAIRIGAILPLTDSYADMGMWLRAGIELAIEDINASQRKTRMILYTEDCVGKPGVAITQYHKLKGACNVDCVFSTLSPVCMSLKPITIADKMLTVGFLGHDEFLLNGGDTLFRYAWTANSEVRYSAEKIIEMEGLSDRTKTVFVHMDNDIGRNFERHYRKSLPGVYKEFVFSEHEPNVKSIAASIAAEKPDCIITYGYTQDLGFLIKAIRECGCSVRIYANQGFSSPSIVQAAGLAGEGVYYPDCDIPESEAIVSIRRKVFQKYGIELSPMTILAYNATQLINNAFTIARTKNSREIADCLKKNSPYKINGMRVDVAINGEITVPFKMVRHKFN